ncbi:hypothetical protein FA15DRAFT_657432 [Coprinopsis marcescibilis]|uniref:GH16 domain-containing protein n=1 Tax=Coprinopsis marcescibilis TaxID=230819 RepID=A0A5C3KQG2_COPMA|nr:hypothetical protein FA15DRAFT_657432 [Coprinopsis marcescibilis]
MAPAIFFGFIIYHSLAALSFITAVAGEIYQLKESFKGYDFFDSWTWETFQDPTHGRVNYVDQETAIKHGLSYVEDDRFVMRANHWDTVIDPLSRGRDSVRIRSTAVYSESLLLLDLLHMPEGCGTWPAWWTLSKAGPWPIGGEIDILEEHHLIETPGVNLNDQNAATLHTSGGCEMTAQLRKQGGKVSSTNCDVAENGNQGCGTTFSKPSSYGSDFNREGGGWYVMQRSEQWGINIWFWSRNDASVPAAVKYHSGDLEVTDEWGVPEASFTFESCPYGDHFDGHQMIFDLTFCGDWAGSTFSAAGCGVTTCDDYVNNNPAAFVNAFWEINKIVVLITRTKVKIGAQHSVQDSFQRLSETVKGHLTLPDTEDNWERISKAITTLTKACQSQAYLDAGDIVQGIRPYHAAIANAMNSERTRLCLAALDLVEAVATECGVQFEPLVSVFLPALVALCGRTNKVITNRTRSCITYIVESTQLASVLPYFTQQMGEKSITIRLVAVESVLACMKCCNPPDLERESRASEIEAIIRKAAKDANADVRKRGRDIFEAYKILLPQRVEKFTAPLTPTMRKYLDIKARDTGRPAMLSRVKSLPSLKVLPEPSSSKPTVKHGRTPSVTSTQATKESSRPPSRTHQPTLRTQPPSKSDQRHAQPRKLVSQSGAAGPSRVIARPASVEPRQTVSRPQRTLPSVTQRQRTLSRPPVPSTSQSTSTVGPRRVPLPPTADQSKPPAAEKPPTSRPNSQQSRRIPVKSSESYSGVAPAHRIPKMDVKSTSTLLPPKPVIPKVRAGLTQPTLSQMAKQRTTMARKLAPAGIPKPTAKLATKLASKAPTAAVLRDGGPKSNAAAISSVKKENPQYAQPTQDVEIVSEGLAEVVEEVVEEGALLSVPAEVEGQPQSISCEHDEERVPTPTIMIRNKSPEPMPPASHTPSQEEDIPLPSVEVTAAAERIPFTPQNHNNLGVGWNTHDAKTPISALLSSIQQGFEFSPGSPLSPPHGYQNGRQMEALSLGHFLQSNVA